MEKDQFIQVVHHFHGSSVQEAQDVLSLKENYPYSQLLHALSARVSKDHGFSTHSGELQLAAVYAADRGVLKEIMLEEFEPLDDGPQGSIVTVTIPAVSEVAVHSPGTSSVSDDSEDVAEEVLNDLERLNELKANFERMFTDGFTPASSKPTEKQETIQTAEDPLPASAELKGGLSKKQRIVALAKARELEQKQQSETPADGTSKKKRKQEGEELIEEIANSKEQIEPENEKQKEQIELIDQFIKTQPSITSNKERFSQPLPASDLANSPAEFGDNIVSETLVEILLKQGKKDRAIEVLKKLIWKFPQKKSYFAAQIEDLKK